MLLYPAHKSVECWSGARWGGMLSIRECTKGRYVIIPRIQICKVLEGMQDGEECYYTPNANMYNVGGDARCKMGRHAKH